MNKLKLFFLSFASIFLMLISATSAFAGGQLASLQADSYGSTGNDSYGRIMRVFIHPEYPCKGTEVTFKFVDPKDGDSITTGGTGQSYVFNQDRQPYFKDGIMGTTCSTYAKFFSKVYGERQVAIEVKKNGSAMNGVTMPYPPVIKVDFDGQYHADNAYNDHNYRSSSDDPYFTLTSKPTPTPVVKTPPCKNYGDLNKDGNVTAEDASIVLKIFTGTIQQQDTKNADVNGDQSITPEDARLIQRYAEGLESTFPVCKNPIPTTGINVWLLSQQSFYPNGRQATIKWGAFDGNPGTFTIYGKTASNKNNWDKLVEGEKGPSYTVKIMPNEDYYIKINGCQDKFGNCVDSNILFIPKIQKDGNITPSQTPNPTVSPTSSGDSSKTDELNKKVENLQNQLDQSKKSQSILEQRVNDLVSFIKKFFPFFK